MTEEQLIAGARREMWKNITVAPVVIFVRLPLGLLFASMEAIEKFLMLANNILPGWWRDYAQALRYYRKHIKEQQP